MQEGKIHLFVALSFSAVLALAACTSSQEVNDENFEKMLDAHFDKRCILLHPAISHSGGYPIMVELQENDQFMPAEIVDRNNADLTAPVDELVHAGLLSSHDGTAAKAGLTMFGGKTTKVTTRVYELANTGRKALAWPGQSDLCVGHYKVEKALQFTGPTNTASSTISEVSFTYSAVDVPDWVSDAEIRKAYPELVHALTEHRRGSRTLFLVSDGWIDSIDFGN